MKKKIAILGGGSSSLALAAFLDPDKFEVTIYEKNKILGKKFLLAGKGGLNLTYSEEIDPFVERYTPDSFLKKALFSFNNEHLCEWLEGVGVPTVVGSSGRVYPQNGIKPSEVLNSIKFELESKGVNVEYEHEFIGWTENNELVFKSGKIVEADYNVFAFGGGSWAETGSDGSWTKVFGEKGIDILPFKPSNCAYGIDWGKEFLANNEGRPLKNMAIKCGEKEQKGEVVITKFGLEGNAIYALNPQIQEQLSSQNKAQIFIDLKPSLSYKEVVNRIEKFDGENMTSVLRERLKLSKNQINLLKAETTKEEFMSAQLITNKIKSLPLVLDSCAPLDEAISTTGGVCLSNVGPYYELNNLKRNYCIGEMLDWDAPTGGYLLQACFSMGNYLARQLNQL